MINQKVPLKISESQTKHYTYFWLGFSIYVISSTFVRTLVFNNNILLAFQALGLVFIISNAIYLIKFKFTNKYLQIVFILYLVWLISIITRGLYFNYQFLKDMLFDISFGIMPYFAPLILLFPKSISTFKKLFKVIVLFSIFYILYDILTIKYLLSNDHTTNISVGIVEWSANLSIPSCFLLLTFNYHTAKRKIISLIIVILSLLFAIYQGRRGLTFILSNQILFSYLINIISSKRKILTIFYSIFLFLIGFFWIYNIAFKKDNPILDYILERGTEDTRTGVEQALYSDFKTIDWVIGRGLSGEYKCPGIDEHQLTDKRSVIETGYLQIILKGGLVSLVLLLLITIPAIYMGLFRSKNTLSKAASAWILLWLLYLYPADMQSFTLYYLIFWLSIGICYSEEIRNFSEDYMKNQLR